MIEAKKVCLKYPDGTVALKNIDFKVDSGQLIYITGPSGSGKTSMLKLMMGMEYPTSGELTVLGQQIIQSQNKNIRSMRRNIGPVFQGFKLIRGRSALENVILGMRFLNINSKQIKEDAKNALIRVGLEHKLLSPVENLSWGETQRVAIARAVARKPRLILADEPTGNLDKNNALNILELLSSFKDNQTTVVITTHATHLIDKSNGAKILNFKEGNISWEGRVS